MARSFLLAFPAAFLLARVPHSLAYAPAWWVSKNVALDAFILQVCTFIALLWYAWETLRMRKALSDQVKALRAQLRVAEEQVEAHEKPCLALFTNPDPSLYEAHGEFIAGTVLTAYASGRIGVQNVGNGPALNVLYQFTPREPLEGDRPSYRGQIPIIPRRAVAVTAVELERLNLFDYEFTCTYTSLSEHVYQSETTIDHLTLQGFVFRLVTVARAKHSDKAEKRARR
jgi:hypothetical protein